MNLVRLLKQPEVNAFVIYFFKVDKFMTKTVLGEIWPKPLEQKFSDDFFTLRPDLFKFEVKIKLNILR